MNANDVIESYVADVAAKLPRKQRNDVAFELRSLLAEELQGKADAAGRAADATMATELVNAFGRAAEVAARYQPKLTVIDPADGHGFVRASVIGLAIIWMPGLLLRLEEASESGRSLLLTLQNWWFSTIIPSLWWPGVLVVAFGLAAWARRRWPATMWKWSGSSRSCAARACSSIRAGYSIIPGADTPHRLRTKRSPTPTHSSATRHRGCSRWCCSTFRCSSPSS
jgi:hypothetical protein